MFRILAFWLTLAGLFAAVSCSSDSGSGTAATSSATTNPVTTPPAGSAHEHAKHGEVHTYACPMHPEVTSTKPGQTCPKCGMKLEATGQQTGSSPTYQVKFAVQPAPPVTGTPATLSFRPQLAGRETEPVPLAVVHEKKMHLIVVSKDLAQFYHEHPEFTAAGDYQVQYTFPKGGDYVLFQDYTPTGASHQLGRQLLTVLGPAYAPATFTRDDLQWEQAGYRATLAFDQAPAVGQPLTLNITITQNGQPVTNLGKYLGALGHVVIISEDTEHYLHVHPNQQTGAGPSIRFGTNFEKPGRYRVFLQFNHGGQIRTGDFTVNVQA